MGNYAEIINRLVREISVHIPLSYYGIVINQLGVKPCTVLDLGCGTGILMNNLNYKRNYSVVGVDIFDLYLKSAKKTGAYKKIIKGNINKIYFPEKSFDIVFCSHVIEHFRKKEGMALLNKMEKIASKKVIIITPMGYVKQKNEDSNSYQEHLSGWYPEDFQKRGYKVIGQGLNIYRKNQIMNNLCTMIGPFKNLFFLIHILLYPFIASKYSLCHQIICIKKFNYN